MDSINLVDIWMDTVANTDVLETNGHDRSQG